MLLMRSPIIRRSSSICASPGPPRMPMPPRWRSRWLQRRTSRVDRYCRRASSTWSLPSWLLRALAEDLEDQHRPVGDRRRRGGARGCAAAPARAPGRRSPPRPGTAARAPSARRPCPSRRRTPRRGPCGSRRRAPPRRRRPTRRAVRARRATRRRPTWRRNRHRRGSPAQALRRRSAGSRSTAPPRRGSAPQDCSDVSGWVWKFTARPGTTVEIACL